MATQKGKTASPEDIMSDKFNKFLADGSGQVIVLALVVIAIFQSAATILPDYSIRNSEGRAKWVLREMGSSQLAYQGTNNPKKYGSFRALQQDQYIGAQYTTANIISGYALDWTVNNPSSGRGCLCSGIGNNTFTIVARPYLHRPKGLSTFAITDDQVLRKFVPANGNLDYSVKSWDPII